MVALYKDDSQTKHGTQASRTRRGEPRPAATRPSLHVVEPEHSSEPPPRVRKDMLPDGTDYEDTGCELAKSCLRCPFETCKYDLIAGGRTLSAEDRDREIAILRAKHNVPLTLLAHAYGVSLRTVFRALREHNGGLAKKSEALRRKRELKAAARQLRLQFDIAPRASMTAGRRRKTKKSRTSAVDSRSTPHE